MCENSALRPLTMKPAAMVGSPSAKILGYANGWRNTVAEAAIHCVDVRGKSLCALNVLSAT